MSVSSFFSEDAPSEWTDVLHQNPLFELLREGGVAGTVERGNLLCEIRGDLFVWSPDKSALLTTNLKRLKAHPLEDQSFQILTCTAPPLAPVCGLVPNGAGSHITLVSDQAVAVMALPRSRGEHGEFGGGKKTVMCRVTPVATDLFTIHHHTLHLLQAHWHPTLPLTLLLLTNDSTLRGFSLADPNYPRFTLPLSPSAANQVHSCSLEDVVVSVAFSQQNRLFALRDTGDVIEISLTPPTDSAPSEPLPMHPMSEDNYGTDDASIDELVMMVDSDVEPLDIIDTTVSSLLGVAVVSESLLGPTLVCLNSDLECQAVILDPSPPAQYVVDAEATPTRPRPQVKPELGGFEKVIRDLLTSDLPDPLSIPRLKSPNPSQQDCFRYLQKCTQNMRERHLLPQQKVKAAIQRRLVILSSQKEQQLIDLMSLRDECAEIKAKGRDITDKMEEIQQRGLQLLNRVERLLCRLDAQSPILSDAEVSMERELGQVQVKAEALNIRVEEAKGKLKLGYGAAASVEGVKMSKAQDDTICSVLEESGKRLLSLKLQIKGLLNAVPS